MLWLTAALAGQEPQEARVAFAGGELLYFHNLPAPAAERPPLLVVLHDNAAGPVDTAKGAWREFQPVAAERGWALAVPWTLSGAPAWTDAGAKAVEAIVGDARKRLATDADRTYLAGFGDGASQVFYLASREPGLWSAAVAVGGSPKRAIDSNRLFAANTGRLPVVWVVRPGEKDAAEPFRKRLAGAGYNLQLQTTESTTAGQTFDWLSRSHGEIPPAKIDCETGSPAFAHCYWLRIVRFDPSLRNDALPSTRVQPGAGAYLDLGGFGYRLSEPGPGVVAGWLPESYKGPLQLGDRIVSVAGQEIRDAKQYAEMMDSVREEKPAAVVVERRGRRSRLETRILLPKREETITARVQAEHLADLQELQIVSRGVAALEVEIPEAWLPLKVNWNGLQAGRVDAAGCWSLQAPGSQARRCAD